MLITLLSIAIAEFEKLLCRCGILFISSFSIGTGMARKRYFLVLVVVLRVIFDILKREKTTNFRFRLFKAVHRLSTLMKNRCY